MNGRSRTAGSARRFVRRAHLWLGLGLGGLFALLGLTGSILVFYVEIDAVLNGPRQIGQSVARPSDYDRAWRTLQAAWPDRQGPWRLEVTGHAGPIPVRYYHPVETAGRDFAPMMAWLSPDGREISRRAFWGDYAMTWIYDLHYRLNAGKRGGDVIGWGGIALLVLLLSGLWAWWPRAGQWRKALRLKATAAPLRRWRDWHKLAGLAGLLPLIVLTGTGVMLALPAQGEAVLALPLGPLDRSPDTLPVPRGVHLTIEGAVAVATKALPAARLAWIETPPAKGGAFRLRMQQPDDPSRRFPHSFVWVDAADGSLLAVQDASQSGASSTVFNWLHPLHDGSAGGLVLRIIFALVGLLPALLFATGVWRWTLRNEKVPDLNRRLH